MAKLGRETILAAVTIRSSFNLLACTDLPAFHVAWGCLLKGVQEGFIPGFESSDREGDECLSGRPALHSWMAVVHKTAPTAICLFAHSPTLSPLLLAGTKKAPVSSIAVEDGRFCRAEEWCCLFLRLVLACAPWHVHVGELLTTFVLRNDTQSKGLCVSGGAPAGSFSCTRKCTRNLSPASRGSLNRFPQCEALVMLCNAPLTFPMPKGRGFSRPAGESSRGGVDTCSTGSALRDGPARPKPPDWQRGGPRSTP